ncbi:MAG: PKHD-type hydroxylase, partial [Thermosynechococcus sp.]
MFLRIDQVLTPEELKQLHCLFQAAPFVDGKLTAGTYAKAVKENQQLQGDSEAYERASEIVLAALRRNILFEAFAQPLAIRP